MLSHIAEFPFLKHCNTYNGKNTFHCMYYIFFIYLPADKYLDCFHITAAVSRAVMTMGVLVPLPDPDSNSFG